MPTHRGLWRNLETPKQNAALERLSAGFRRPAPSGSPDRLDASLTRHGAQAFANQLLRVHRIVLIEHDYPKAADAARTSYFSVRIPGAADGSGSTTINILYDGTTTGIYATQNLVGQFQYTADGAYTAVASAASGDFAGRRRLFYPQPAPMVSPYEIVSPPPGGPPVIEREAA